MLVYTPSVDTTQLPVFIDMGALTLPLTAKEYSSRYIHLSLLSHRKSSLANFPSILMGTCHGPLSLGTSSACFCYSSRISWENHSPLSGERGVFICCPCSPLKGLWNNPGSSPNIHEVKLITPIPGNSTWPVPKGQSDALLLLTNDLQLLPTLLLCSFLTWEVSVLASQLRTCQCITLPWQSTCYCWQGLSGNNMPYACHRETHNVDQDGDHRNYAVGYLGRSALLTWPDTNTEVSTPCPPISMTTSNAYSG